MTKIYREKWGSGDLWWMQQHEIDTNDTQDEYIHYQVERKMVNALGLSQSQSCSSFM
jgi:hypothetical protein